MDPVLAGALADAIAPLIFSALVMTGAIIGTREYPPETRRARLIVAGVLAAGGIVAAIARFVAAMG